MTVSRCAVPGYDATQPIPLGMGHAPQDAPTPQDAPQRVLASPAPVPEARWWTGRRLVAAAAAALTLVGGGVAAGMELATRDRPGVPMQQYFMTHGNPFGGVDGDGDNDGVHHGGGRS